MMDTNPNLQALLAALRASVEQTQLVKLTLSKPTAAAGDLKSIDIRPILVKRELRLSFTYHHRTRDIVKNYVPAEAEAHVREYMLQQFRAARLQTTTADYHLAKTGEGYTFNTTAPTQKAAPELAHDRAKQRLVTTHNKPYLHALGITDANGNVYKNAQDKFRQINKYIEILDGLLRQLPADLPLRIVDMGAGKGYLTFALYDYITTTLARPAHITGVEFRADLVEKCNSIARAAEFTGLQFVEGTIASYRDPSANIVIALHACDTATDDAIYGAIAAGAQLIVVAPCCHKQIRREMEKHAASNTLQPLLKHGTYVERMAEMVTDGLRAQLMEQTGYRTKLFEFISGEHTPKNVMIVGTKSANLPNAAEAEAQQNAIRTLKAEFGVTTHYLETLLTRRN